MKKAQRKSRVTSFPSIRMKREVSRIFKKNGYEIQTINKKRIETGSKPLGADGDG
jgi:ribosomal protein S8